MLIQAEQNYGFDYDLAIYFVKIMNEVPQKLIRYGNMLLNIGVNLKRHNLNQKVGFICVVCYTTISFTNSSPVQKRYMSDAKTLLCQIRNLLHKKEGFFNSDPSYISLESSYILWRFRDYLISIRIALCCKGCVNESVIVK